MDTNNSQEECLITNNNIEENVYFEIIYKLKKINKIKQKYLIITLYIKIKINVK